MSSWVALSAALLAIASEPDGGSALPEPAGRPPIELELLASATFSMEVGARTLSSFERLTAFTAFTLSQTLAFDETGPWRRFAAIAGRLARLALLDGPISAFLATVQHEVFGHGARARELGAWPEYGFSVPPPYGLLLGPQQYLGVTYYPATLVTGRADRDLPLSAGGIEANIFLAHLSSMRIIAARRERFATEALGYLINQSAYFSRWFSPRPFAVDSRGVTDDPDAYFQVLLQRFNLSGAQTQVSDRLRGAAFSQLLNPLVWLSLYQVVFEFVGRGAHWSPIPRLRVGAVELLPVTRFALSPFGAEHTLDVVIMAQRFTLDASVRAVSTGLAFSSGAGARLFGWKPVRWLEVGGSLDLWVQPELLPDYRNAFDGVLRPGVSAMVEATWRPLDHWGFTAQLGGKSSGYVMSQPLAASVFGHAGVVLSLDPPR